MLSPSIQWTTSKKQEIDNVCESSFEIGTGCGREKRFSLKQSNQVNLMDRKKNPLSVRNISPIKLYTRVLYCLNDI